MQRSQNSVRNRRPSCGFRWRRSRGASSEFLSESTTLSWFSAGSGTGACSVLRVLLVNEDLLVVFARASALANGAFSDFLSEWKMLSCAFRRAAALVRGAFSEYCSSESTTFLWFSAGGGPRAWSAFRFLSPLNTVQNQRHSRGFGRLAALACGA